MRRGFSVVLLTIMLCGGAAATTYVLHPDGTGDFPTIQAAIDAVVDGDVIELTDGPFTGDGNRDMDYLGKAITIRSQSGDPDLCIIHCGVLTEEHRGFHFHSDEGPGSVLSGIKIRDGRINAHPGGGAALCEGDCAPSFVGCTFRGNLNSAIYCHDGAAPTFTDCTFILNEGFEGGAVNCETASLVFNDCDFIKNSAQWCGGAFYAGPGASSVFTNCWFWSNGADCAGAVNLVFSGVHTFTGCFFQMNMANEYGAMMIFFSTGVLEHCTFAHNFAEHLGGAIFMGKMGQIYARNCTFWTNGSPHGTLCFSEMLAVLDNCIIADGLHGPAISGEATISLSCCNLYGNAGGDWVGPIADQYGVNGNIAEDPLFCDPESYDFTLHEDSPCAPFTPPNEECDLIGAWPIGCGPTSIERMSWGAIKARFKR